MNNVENSWTNLTVDILSAIFKKANWIYLLFFFFPRLASWVKHTHIKHFFLENYACGKNIFIPSRHSEAALSQFHVYSRIYYFLSCSENAFFLYTKKLLLVFFFIKTLFSKRCCIPLPAQDEVKSNPLELWPFHQGHRITY